MPIDEDDDLDILVDVNQRTAASTDGKISPEQEDDIIKESSTIPTANVIKLPKD